MQNSSNKSYIEVRMFDYTNCPIFYKDFYKVSHVEQYPWGTDLVFSNFTPRNTSLGKTNYSVFFGLQYLLKEYLIDRFNKYFFEQDVNVVYSAYKEFMNLSLNSHKSFDHIADLHSLGYLPIEIFSLPEGTLVPEKVPALVIFNTNPAFYWLPNALESLLSCTLWQGCTSATIAHKYHEILKRYQRISSDNINFVDWQSHDFSLRGMSSLESAIISGMAHLHYFHGTDNIPALAARLKYYGDALGRAGSIPATEHSVMCAAGDLNEYSTFDRLITEIYPKGPISIVSDTWDFWYVIEGILPLLKDKIMSRDGKVIIRPDSGNPVDIICGSEKLMRSPLDYSHLEEKGLIECLWDIFGGTINSKGYKELDPHIGAIYGDSITLEICEEICEKLIHKGFSSTNIVFGVGSYTYQHNTRDTFGWAMKSTYVEINGKGHEIFKDPITDNGTKKSHKGLLKVINSSPGNYPPNLECIQKITWPEFYEKNNELKLRFQNGKLYDGIETRID